MTINRSSRCVRIFFQILMAMVPIMLIWYWLNAPGSVGFPDIGFSYQFLPQGMNIMHELTWYDRLLGFMISSISTVFYYLMMLAIVRLFKLYEKNIIFTQQNVLQLTRIGNYLILAQLMYFVTQPFLTLAMSLGNPPGHRYIALTLNDTNIGFIIIGMMIVIISKIMKQAKELHDDQQLTI